VTRGSLPPEDALTSDDPALAALLAAAGAPADAGPLPGEAEALAAFRAANGQPLAGVGHRPRRARRATGRTSLRLAAAALTGSVVLAGGLAAAATGSLPGAAQQTAKDMLSKVGVTVPGPADQAGEHPARRGKSGTSGQVGQRGSPEPSTNPGKGPTVGESPTTTTETRVRNGAEVSDTSSGGKSRAGERDAPATTRPAPRVPPRTGGGTGRQADAPRPAEGRAPSAPGAPGAGLSGR
jgi:hypothetical protein